MDKIDTSKIYPEANWGRLKTTDDKSKAIQEDEHILYADVHDEIYEFIQAKREELKVADWVVDIFKILLRLAVPMFVLWYALRHAFPPMRIIFGIYLFLAIAMVVISVVSMISIHLQKQKYKKVKEKEEAKKEEQETPSK